MLLSRRIKIRSKWNWLRTFGMENVQIGPTTGIRRSHFLPTDPPDEEFLKTPSKIFSRHFQVAYSLELQYDKQVVTFNSL